MDEHARRFASALDRDDGLDGQFKRNHLAAFESLAEYQPVDDCRRENGRGKNDFDRNRRCVS